MKRERSRITAEVFFCGRYPSTLTLQVPLHGLACQEAVRSRSELRKNAERKVALLPRIQQALKDRLTDLAKHEHRSLNQQIEFLLEEGLSGAAKKQHLIWIILHNGVRYQERSLSVSERANRVRTSRMIRTLRMLGYRVEPAVTPA